MTDTTTTTKAPKSRPVSFSPEELQRVIAEAVAAATAQAKAEFAEALAAKPSATNGKSQASMQNEVAVVKAFKKAGFGNVTPHEDVGPSTAGCPLATAQWRVRNPSRSRTCDYSTARKFAS